MGRVARVARFVVGGLAVVAWIVALALAAVTIASRTEWGRRKIARAVETRLEAIFDGDVQIGGVSGALPGTVVLDRFKLVRGGEVVLAAEKLTMRWDVLAVRGRTFHVDELILEAPLVRTDKLAGLMRPTPESAPWHLRIDDLGIEDGQVLAEGRTIDGVTVKGELDFYGKEGHAIISEARARWKEQELTAVARARIGSFGGHLVVADVRVDTNRGWAYMPLLIDRSALASAEAPDFGRAVAILAGTKVAALAEVRHAPAFVDVKLHGDLERQTVEARVDGRIGGTSLRDLRIVAERRGAEEVAVTARMGRDRVRGVLGVARGWIEASIRRPELSLEGRTRYARHDGTTRLDLERLAFTARRLHGHARGGEVVLAPDGSVTVNRLGIDTDAGRIEVEGVLAGVGKQKRGEGRLHLHVLALDLGKLRQALGVAGLPRSGTFSADLHAMRRGREIVFDGDVAGEKLSWRPQDPLVDLHAHVGLSRGRLLAQADLEAGRAGHATVTLDTRAPRQALDARAWKRLSAEDVHDAKVRLVGLDLATVAKVIGRPGAFFGTVDGEIEVPEHGRGIQATLKAARLMGREVDGEVEMSWDRDGLDAVVVGALGGARVGEATVHLDLPMGAPIEQATHVPLKGKLVIEGFPIDRLNRVGLVRSSLAGVLIANLDVTGSGVDPHVKGEARLLGAHVGVARFYEARVAGEADLHGAQVKVHALQAGGGLLDGDVRAPRDPAAPIDAKITARAFDVGFLGALAPDTDLAGRLDADLTVSGSRTAPALRGQLALTKGRAIIQGGARRLDDVTLRARLAPGRVQLDELHARTGSGHLEASGEADLDGFNPRRFRVDVKTRRVPVAAGTRVVSVDLEGQLRGTSNGRDFTIDAEVQRGLVRMPRDKTAQLQPLGELEDVTFVDRQALEERKRRWRRERENPPTQVTLRVKTPRGVRVRGPDLEARVNADLTIKSGGGKTSIAGFVDVSQGTATVFDRRYEIVYARAWYDGVTTNPQIDVRLAHEFRTATVYVSLGGTLKEPRLKLSSDPAIYDEAQLLGFVLGGDPDDPSLADRKLEDRAVGVATSMVASQVKNRLREVLPVDVLRVDLEEDQTGQQGARFEIGKWLTDNILLGYRFRSTSEDQENTNEATVEWHFLRRWMLEARYGDRGVGSADLLWRKRY